MSVYGIVQAAVAAGAPSTTQVLAVRMATQALDSKHPPLAGQALEDLRHLVSQDLDEPAAAELRAHRNEKVRAAAWAARSVSRELFLAHIAVETSATVRAGMLASPHAQDTEVADLLCTPMRQAVAKAATARSSTVSPAQRVVATVALAPAFNYLSREQRSAICHGILTLPVNPADVLADDRLPVVVRVAAAANRRLPLADLDQHLPHLLDVARVAAVRVPTSQRDEWFDKVERYLNAVAGRDDLTERIVDAVRDLRTTHARLISPLGEWTKWLNPEAWAERTNGAPAPTRAVPALNATVAACTSTRELTTLWDGFSPSERDEGRQVVALHQLCDLALFTRATAGVDSFEEWVSLAGGQVWCFESEDVWRRVIAQNVNTAWRWVANDRAPEPLRALVFDWFVDELLAPQHLEHGRWRLNVDLWREVTTDPRFPKDRFDQLDDDIVLPLMESGPDWIRTTVFDRLEALPADRLDAALRLMPALEERGLVFGALLTTTSAALAD